MKQRIEFKVGLFIIVATLLIIASIGYVAYKKDVFSKVYTYTLSSETGENITEGMPVLFWGFNIGKVSSMKLTETGVLIEIEISERNNRVIRADSRFVLDKPLLGTSRIIVYTSDLNGPPLSADTFPKLTVTDDINELIKRVQTIAEKMDILAGNLTTITGNLTAITGNIADPQGDMNRIIKNAERVTSRFAENESLVEMLVGNRESAETIQEVIDNAHNISINLDGILKKLDALTEKTDEELYGREGISTLLEDILRDLIVKLENFEVTLENLDKASEEAAKATKDLDVLRSDVDETVNAIRSLVDDLDRMIPFKEESEFILP